MKRRRFLTLAGVAAGVAISSTSLQPPRQFAKDQLRGFLGSLRHPDPTTTGELDPFDLGVLMAVTTALLPDNIERTHYEDFFRWRAENLPGYQDLYSKFVAELEQQARQLGVLGFVERDSDIQMTLINKVIPKDEDRPGRVEELKRLAFDRDRWLFKEYIFNDILQLFARTDAVKMMGYQYWMGQKRGLETYRQPKVPPAKITSNVKVGSPLSIHG